MTQSLITLELLAGLFRKLHSKRKRLMPKGSCVNFSEVVSFGRKDVIGFQSITSLKISLCKSYRPEARGYVIYPPRALREGAARGQRTRGINHITTS